MLGPTEDAAPFFPSASLGRPGPPRDDGRRRRALLGHSTGAVSPRRHTSHRLGTRLAPGRAESYTPSRAHTHKSRELVRVSRGARAELVRSSALARAGSCWLVLARAELVRSSCGARAGSCWLVPARAGLVRSSCWLALARADSCAPSRRLVQGSRGARASHEGRADSHAPRAGLHARTRARAMARTRLALAGAPRTRLTRGRAGSHAPHTRTRRLARASHEGAPSRTRSHAPHTRERWLARASRWLARTRAHSHAPRAPTRTYHARATHDVAPTRASSHRRARASRASRGKRSHVGVERARVEPPRGLGRSVLAVGTDSGRERLYQAFLCLNFPLDTSSLLFQFDERRVFLDETLHVLLNGTIDVLFLYCRRDHGCLLIEYRVHVRRRQVAVDQRFRHLRNR